VVSVHVEGWRETIKAMRGIPKDATDAIRTASTDIAASEVAHVRAAANTRQAAAAARTLRVRRDRFPALVIGGAARVTSHGGRAGDVVFGSEFGAAPTTPGGFHAYRGHTGYFLYPTLRRDMASMWARWLDAVGDIVSGFEA
jgi:hypothetical protein